MSVFISISVVGYFTSKPVTEVTGVVGWDIRAPDSSGLEALIMQPLRLKLVYMWTCADTQHLSHFSQEFVTMFTMSALVYCTVFNFFVSLRTTYANTKFACLFACMDPRLRFSVIRVIQFVIVLYDNGTCLMFLKVMTKTTTHMWPPQHQMG